MLVRWLLAAIHLLAFGFALASILRRAWALRQLGAASAASTSAALQAAFRADSGWGLSALVLVVTGLMRAFGGFEKGADYYLDEPLFHVKMTALALILILEVPPMISLIRWRIALKKGATPDLRRAPMFARISVIQTLLLIVMVFAASGMARGIGLPDGAV
jgi:putative membrane protein